MSETRNPWLIDISHWQDKIDWKKVKAGGIKGVLIKASQGTRAKDVAYDRHVKGADSVGLLRGAYHFGTFADGKAQADFFLKTVFPDGKIDSSILLALDFEDDPRNAQDMTGFQARDFVVRIKEKTGRWPMFYSAKFWTQPHLEKAVWSTMINCPLWLAGYVRPEKLQIPLPWKKWTVWQYTEGLHGIEPRATPGVVGTCDRGFWGGTEQELIEFWTGQMEPEPSDFESAAHLDHQPEVSKPVESPESPAAAPPSQVADTIVNTAPAAAPAPPPTGEVEVKKQSPSVVGRVTGAIGVFFAGIGTWWQSTGIDINAAIANGSAGKVLAVAAALLVKVMPFLLIGGALVGVYYFAIWRAQKRESIEAKTAADPAQNTVKIK